jgi:hypothetical protein
VIFSGTCKAEIALTIRDSTYLLEFLRHEFESESPEALETSIIGCITAGLRGYEKKYMEKFLGVAFPKELADRCPRLCSRIWKDLDIVPFVLHDSGEHSWGDLRQDNLNSFNLDEQAEAIARSCIRFVSSMLILAWRTGIDEDRFFAPNKNPLLEVGFRGNVEVDAAFHAQLATAADYENTVNPVTWQAVIKYATDLKERKVKIAFFSSTPQGGGVALMRHSLGRFTRSIGVDLNW